MTAPPVCRPNTTRPRGRTTTGPGASPITEEKATPRQAPAKKGAVIDLEIESLAYGGRGIARPGGYVVFVPNVVPGDRVRAVVTRRKKSHGEAKLVEVIAPSPRRVDPVCPIAGRCGGCPWQHIALDEQQRWKTDIVRGALRPIAGLDLDSVQFDPLAESPLPLHYRNKMEFTFGRATDGGRLELGFHEAGNWRHILDAERCWLPPAPTDRLLDAVRDEGERQGLSAWNPKTHCGTLRQFVVRWSFHENKVVVALLTGDTELDFAAMNEALRAACPELKGVAWGLNDSRSDVARADRILDARGDVVLVESVCGRQFRVSLESFFQTNSLGAEVLYATAREFLGLTGTENLLDAYCGAGSIGICCADGARHVYGIEIVREAIRDARENARRNGLENCTFIAGDMASSLNTLTSAIAGPVDRLVVDPPRAGMDKKSLAQLVGLRAPVLVYVSCNPTTMARDLQVVHDAGYRIERVRPVDMFPQTYHIECVTRCVYSR